MICTMWHFCGFTKKCRNQKKEPTAGMLKKSALFRIVIVLHVVTVLPIWSYLDNNYSLYLKKTIETMQICKMKN